MSQKQARRKRQQQKIPGIREARMPDNGDSIPNIPPDLEWPVSTYSCSHNTEHAPNCDGSCTEIEWTESQVKIENVRREFARNGMSWIGLPEGLPLPVSGIQVDLVDLLCRVLTLEELAFEIHGINREEYDEKFRENKLEFLQTILDQNKEQVRKARLERTLGLGKKQIFGPGGEPIG